MISLQGLSLEKHLKVCGVPLDVNEMIENVTDFYKNRKGCSVFIKMIDAILSGKEEEAKFFD